MAQASDRYARTARRKTVNMQRTSVVLDEFLTGKGMPEAERLACLRRPENWSSWVRSETSEVVRLVPQEAEDDQIRAIPDSEMDPRNRVQGQTRDARGRALDQKFLEKTL